MAPIFRKRRRSWPARIIRALLGLATLLAIGTFCLYLYLMTALPQTKGSLDLPGLTAEVTVYRDGDAVPHIFAGNENDAYEALGFLHAQDRLFQMDLTRHVGAGRLAEWFPAAIDSDRMMRTLDIGGLAKRAYAGLPAEEQAALVAYARGVNAYLDAHTGAWPLEYYVAMARPEPWQPSDSLIWPRLMAMSLGANWQDEELHALLRSKLTDEQYRELFEPEGGTFTTLARNHEADPLIRHLLARSRAALPEELGAQIASNAWAIDGKHSASGKAILANDPHLGFSAPGIWYLAEIDTPNLKMAGVTAPGAPLIVLGQNEHIAWGATTTYADTQDLFVERVTPGQPDNYDAPDGPRKFATREEIIHVRGADDVRLTVRTTRHGPVISDLKGDAAALAKEGYAIALSATMLDEGDTGYDAFFHVDRARSWDEFREAMRSFRAPVQNFMAADQDGRIGLIAAGTIPIRASGDGLAPAPGWDGSADWISTIPFDQLPQRVDPESGRLVNANNRLVGPDYPYLISGDWIPSTRAKRIDEALNAVDRPSAEGSAKLQGDVVSLTARDLIPLLSKPGGSARTAEAKALLASWDGEMSANRPEPLIYAAWLRLFIERQLGPMISAALADSDNKSWAPFAPTVARIVKGDSVWCDGGTAPKPVPCDAAIEGALEAAIERLTQRYGTDMANWRWGDAHPARHANQVLSRLPAIGGWFAPSAPVGGDSDTVNKGAYRYRPGTLDFTDVHGPSYRAVYDLGDRTGTRVGLPVGQSGHSFSGHFDDFLTHWVKDELRPLFVSPGQLAASGADRLALKPESHP
jgi:penicillin amidase